MQIFEIDEDHGAGTPIDSTLLPPSHAARQRRLSQYSYGQMSDTPDKPKTSSPAAPTFTISPVPEQETTQSQPAQPESAPNFPSSGGDHGSARLQSLPTILGVPPRGPSRPIQTRPRINSLVNPAASSASPLAMLFQPIVVEEEAVADDLQDDLAKPPNLLSYGPASRRRVISVSTRRHGRTLVETSSATSALNRWQQDTGQSSRSPTRSDEGDLFSRSPDPINHSTLSVPETAAQVLEEEEREGGEPGLSKRLEMIEARQKRIEEMLMKLTERLS